MKRNTFLPLILALCMLAVIAPASFAADETTLGGAYATITTIADEGGTLTVLIKTDTDPAQDILLRMTSGTAVLDNETREAADFSSLKEGDEVFVYHSLAMTRSLPPQSECAAIITNVEKGKAYAMLSTVATITENEDGGIKFLNKAGDLVVTVPNDAPVSRFGGEKGLSVSDIREGDTVFTWFLVTAMSFPAQAQADEVVIFESSGAEEPGASTEGTGAAATGSIFADVNESAWYVGDVMFAYENGLMNGTSENPMLFSPNANLTRGMVVTVLWRMAGSSDERVPAAAGGGQFSDVAESAYYCQAVNWAAKNDIVTGIGGGKFAPDANITRQDLAVVLMRYMNNAEINFVLTADYLFFADDSQIADYANSAIQSLNKLGIMRGTGENAINPRGQATRAEFAAMLHRFVDVANEMSVPQI
ncbi:MAG: S-layer homology domain-containing protein [Clostridiales bacterium]|nr:S-layer homology domain-containing protein [Clostridiales bacterium]